MISKIPEFSLITIANKENIYQEFKKGLLKQQNINYELIKVKNDHNQFSSARKAYNTAAKKASGKYLVFLHPDIRFLDRRALYDVLKQITALNDFGIAGIAGSPKKLWKNDQSYIVTTMIQGINKEHVGEKINKVTEVQTVDECFFVMKRSYWQLHPFSDIQGWHFYSVEQCLRAIQSGKHNYVVPSRIWHLSTGVSEDSNYVKIGKIIVQRYGQNFPYINTTVTKWDTHGLKKYYTPWLHLAEHRLFRVVKKHKKIYSFGRSIKHHLITN